MGRFGEIRANSAGQVTFPRRQRYRCRSLCGRRGELAKVKLRFGQHVSTIECVWDEAVTVRRDDKSSNEEEERASRARAGKAGTRR